jgi:hypothetical protein
MDLATTDSAPDIQCPECRAIDWVCDGFEVAARERCINLWTFAPRRDPDARWACGQCGYALEGDTRLAHALTFLQETHLGLLEPPLQGGFQGAPRS